MSLYAMGDLHLHFQTEVKARFQLTDPVWRDHESRVAANCARLVRPGDTLVLLGDHSWGKKLAQCQEDLRFIEDLPGRKVLFRGNHDMFWDANRTASLNDQYKDRLEFVQNGFAAYRDWALVGTKGYTFEGPFYLDRRGRVKGWDEEAKEQADKLVERETERLRLSFEAARAAGYSRFLMFLHYPPTNILERESGFTRMAEQYGAEQVIYAHCHGRERFHDSLLGTVNGVRYSLASGDYLLWRPMLVV